MSIAISVSQLCHRSTELHLCGYSEEVLDNLIRNGDLQGFYNAELGGLIVNDDVLLDFMPTERKRWLVQENDYEEKLINSTNYEGML
jgi:hypothetical protein